MNLIEKIYIWDQKWENKIFSRIKTNEKLNLKTKNWMTVVIIQM